jgi:DNA-binding LacI/PurR family transcriptional regulator
MALTKHQLIQNDIRAKITRGDLAPGAPLPSQQELMATYGVAQGTVRQALDRLQADGLVIAHRGKGTYVNQPSPSPAKPAAVSTIGLIAVCPKERFTLLHDIFLFVQRSVAQQGYELNVRFFDPSEHDLIVQWSLKQAGVIIWSAAHTALVDRLVELAVPTAVLGELCDGPCPPGANWIHYNIDDTISLALGILQSMNHKHVWFVSRRGTQYYDHLAQAFDEQTKLAQLDQTFRFVNIPLIQDEPQIVSLLESAPIKPTALLIEGDVRASRLIHILQQANCRIPDDVSIIALGASDPERLGVRDLYRIVTDAQTGVATTIQALADSIRTGRVVRHVIAPRIAPGKSCVPIPSTP